MQTHRRTVYLDALLVAGKVTGLETNAEATMIHTHTHTANASFENVAKFEYFGTINQEQIKFTEFLLLFRRIFCLPVYSIKPKDSSIHSYDDIEQNTTRAH